MSETPNSPEPANEPEWLNDIEDYADSQLANLDDGAACEQVHPFVERWYKKLMDEEPPASRDAVLQAMACLSSELMNSIPEDIFASLMEVLDEDEIAGWIEYVLMVGRAFEVSLKKGEFDDL
jgi:hypothetical protein